MPNKVVFNEVTYCALVQAFRRNTALLARWGAIVSTDDLETIINIPPDLHWCTLSERAGMIWQFFAQVERERLATCGHEHGLRCEHTAAQHRDALDAILKQLLAVH